MNQTDYLRLALLLSDGQAQTFKKNLLKIIMLVLAENYGNALTVSDIIKKIENNYSLSFADGEIRTAIFSAKNGTILEDKGSKDPVYFTFALSPAAYENFKNRQVTDPLLPFIEQFCQENSDTIALSSEELKNVVYRFLYQGFNSDIETVLALMNYRGESEQWKLEAKGFTNAEIIDLDHFLNWQNSEKNKLIFKYVSFCYEYCIMTVKKDKSAFSNIFRGKEFYLDANIIFRLAGFNKAERKDSVTAFLNKCQECGVHINYTNFTSTEISTTLEYYVKALSGVLGNTPPMAVDAVKRLNSKYANMDFYEQYVEWTKEPQNKIGDFSAFLDDLKRKINKCTRFMKIKVYETFNQMQTKEKFAEYCRDLTSFKSSRNKWSNDASIQVDVENYMTIQNLIGEAHAVSFFDQKYSFITADHVYIDWTREKLPGTVPLFVLPSVWYSIMLKYHGRTDDDYAAFCQFINLRISDVPDEQQEKKDRILACIMQLNESADIKDEIAFDISKRLTEMENFVEDVETYVRETHERITEARVAAAVEEVDEVYKRRIADEQQDHERELKYAQRDYEQKLQEARNAEYQKGHDQGNQEGQSKGLEQGRKEGRKEIIHNQAVRKAKNNRRIRIASICVCGICVVIFACLLVIQYCIGENATADILEFINEHSAISMIISGAGTILSILFAHLGKYVTFFSTDVKKLEEKMMKKEDKMSKS